MLICMNQLQKAAGGGEHRATPNNAQQQSKKKESIVDLSKYLDKQIHVKFQGGREGK